MPEQPDPSAFEKAASHPMASLAANALPVGAAFAPLALLPAGAPLLALIPALAGMAAVGRFQSRIETWLKEVSADVDALSIQVDQISDEQYKLIGACVSAAMRGESAGRLELLRRAVRGVLKLNELPEQDASELGRILRDMTTVEARFVAGHFHFAQIWLAPGPIMQAAPDANSPTKFAAATDSPEGEIVKGLITLGVLINAGGGYDGVSIFQFSRVTAKLLTLLDAKPLR